MPRIVESRYMSTTGTTDPKPKTTAKTTQKKQTTTQKKPTTVQKRKTQTATAVDSTLDFSAIGPPQNFEGRRGASTPIARKTKSADETRSPSCDSTQLPGKRDSLKFMMLKYRIATTKKWMERVPQLLQERAERSNEQNEFLQNQLKAKRELLREQENVIAQLQLEKTGKMDAMKLKEIALLTTIADEKEQFEENIRKLTPAVKNFEQSIKFPESNDPDSILETCEDVANKLAIFDAESCSGPNINQLDEEVGRIKKATADIKQAKERCVEMEEELHKLQKKRIADDHARRLCGTKLFDFKRDFEDKFY